MDFSKLSFPYVESIQWVSPEIATNFPASPLKEWLITNSSLTAKLRAFSPKFEVKLLSETFQQGRLNNEVVNFMVREVLLCLDDTPWVFARSLLPDTLVNESNLGFAQLGTKPIGELLFSNQNIILGEMSISQFNQEANSDWPMQVSINQLWGRKRNFHYKNQRIIVTEVFLPAVENLLTSG